MGPKRTGKRDNHPFYLACFILTLFFISGCSLTGLNRELQQQVGSTRDYTRKEDYRAAARENEALISRFSRPSNGHTAVYTDHLAQSQTIAVLLDRIIRQQESEEGLQMKLLYFQEQLKARDLAQETLKTKINAMAKKLAKKDTLIRKIRKLEQENQALQKQIDRLKEIDLAPAKGLDSSSGRSA